ncbi:ATP-binding protein [Streptomyces canus]|uniref:ATP-binding protein n=1 Tax=Streptomyces canus TaxID=58343 RepID=UPI0033AAEFB9
MTAGLDGGVPTVRVVNSGPVIPRELAPSLYQPFQRLGHRSARADGHGLGLSIVTTHQARARIVTEQGPERGLDIFVAFPAARTSCTRRPTRSPPAARLSPGSARIGVGDVRALRRMRRATDQLRGDKGSCPGQERP